MCAQLHLLFLLFCIIVAEQVLTWVLIYAHVAPAAFFGSLFFVESTVVRQFGAPSSILAVLRQLSATTPGQVSPCHSAGRVWTALPGRVPPGRAGAQGHRKIEAEHLIFPPPLIFPFSEGVLSFKKECRGKNEKSTEFAAASI